MDAAGDKIIGELASQFSLDGSSARKALDSIIPEFASGILGKAEEPTTFISDFARAVQSGAHAKYVEAPESLAEDATIEDGNKILGHVLGSKDKSREVAKKTAEQTGIDYGTVKKMLPVVAAAAMGGLSKSGVGSQILGAVGGDDVTGLLEKLL